MVHWVPHWELLVVLVLAAAAGAGVAAAAAAPYRLQQPLPGSHFRLAAWPPLLLLPARLLVLLLLPRLWVDGGKVCH